MIKYLDLGKKKPNISFGCLLQISVSKTQLKGERGERERERVFSFLSFCEEATILCVSTDNGKVATNQAKSSSANLDLKNSFFFLNLFIHKFIHVSTPSLITFYLYHKL